MPFIKTVIMHYFFNSVELYNSEVFVNQLKLFYTVVITFKFVFHNCSFKHYNLLKNSFTVHFKF